MKTERRKFIKNLGLAAAGSVVLPAVTKGADFSEMDLAKPQSKLDFDELKKYSSKAKQLVDSATSTDMLAGFGDYYHKRDGMIIDRMWRQVPNSFTKSDYEFVRSCGINVFGWGEMRPTFESMLEFVAEQNGIVASNPDYFERIDTKEKLANLLDSKKIGVFITNQESSHFRTVDDVDLFYGLGQRLSQLTYNGPNRIGCGAFVDNDTGLTDYGRLIIERMEKVGMAVDVAHCGDKTTMDAIEASTRPVIITHAACRTLAPGIARAKTDDAIKAMAKTGGVIGMPILRFMIRNQEPVHLEHFIEHIDHVAQLVGVEYVGIGSDAHLYTEDYKTFEERKATLDGAPPKYQCHSNEDYLITIKGLDHPYRTYDIAEALIKKGYKDEHIKMVLGDNFKNVFMKIFKD